MGKPTICIGENKDADQLRGNREADQRLCFRYSDSTIPLLSKSQISSLVTVFCDCTAWFVSDLVGNPNCWFCHTQAPIDAANNPIWLCHSPCKTDFADLITGFSSLLDKTLNQGPVSI